ncbi:SDR family NAD(P)-dependent oxidoreductase [Weissella paramesenteroides]
MTNLDNSIAIITGASSGMGKAIAKELAKQHVTVVLTARRRERLEALVQEISENGGKAMAIPADLTSKDEAEKVVKTTIEKYEHLDILVNKEIDRHSGINNLNKLEKVIHAAKE